LSARSAPRRIVIGAGAESGDDGPARAERFTRRVRRSAADDRAVRSCGKRIAELGLHPFAISRRNIRWAAMGRAC